jgi:asparagine synthase (glutamine-hydrolysing)
VPWAGDALPHWHPGPEMCGIAGFWNLRSGRPADPEVIRSMTSTLTHRGPDDEGYRVEGALALGMRRLRVVDPAGGTQPMPNEDGSVQVVFNGEIYNHGELRRELEGRGHRFRTRSDTEVLVHGYEEWSDAFLERLNGMFAIALWDRSRARLLLARDRLGIKPLYLAEGPDGVVFGSELKAVVASPLVPLAWDLEALDDFMTYEYVPAPASIVRGVEKLRPGHRVVFRADRPGARDEGSFWSLVGDGSFGASFPDPEETRRELLERLGVAVRKRMVADVPLGAFLSGGIDSSAVVALMRGGGGRGAPRDGPAVCTFALGFGDPSYDEREYARRVAKHLGTTHVEREVTPEVVGLAQQVIGYFDEPFADVSAFPTLLLSRLAREDVTVALSGDGGDELFAGYDHYRAHRWDRRLRWLGGRLGWRAADRILDLIPPSSSKKGPVNVAQRFAEGALRPRDLEHARWWVFWDLEERRRLYSAGLARALDGRDCFAHYRGRLQEGTDRGFRGLQRQLYSDVTGYLPDDILTKVDRMSMATSLEARVPFLDHEFVEFAMALPDAWKLRRGTSKWILKEALREELPASVLRRGKAGFSMPMKNWLRGPLRPFMDDLLGRVRTRGWFHEPELERLSREHLRGRRNHAHRLWCLMSLELSLQGLEQATARRDAPEAPNWSDPCPSSTDTGLESSICPTPDPPSEPTA